MPPRLCQAMVRQLQALPRWSRHGLRPLASMHWLPRNVQKHIHIHLHSHIRINIYTYHIYIYIGTYTYVCTCVLICMYTHMATYIYIYIYIFIHTHIHTYIHTYIYTYTSTCTPYIHVHVHIHTCTDTSDYITSHFGSSFRLRKTGPCMSLGRVLVSLLGTRNSLSPFRLLYVVSPSASCFRGREEVQCPLGASTVTRLGLA